MADIKYLITVDDAGAVKSVKNFDETLSDLAKHSDTAKTAHGGLWKDIALGQFAYDTAKKAARLMVDTVKDSIVAATEAEKSEAALASALATTGRNVEQTLPSLVKYANELMSQTVYDDEAIKGAMALTAQLTNLNEKGIKEATKGALGLASVFGMDLQSAARAVAQGYEGNFMALGRLIPEIRNAKTESEKHAAMVEGLAKMYGRAQDETDTFSGSLKQLNNSWGELKETIGGAITNNESVRKGLKEVKTEVDNLAKSDDFKLWLSAVVDGLVWAGKAAGTFARMCKEMTEDVFKSTKADADYTESLWALERATARATEAGHDFDRRKAESAETAKKAKEALDLEAKKLEGLTAALRVHVEVVQNKFIPTGQKTKYVIDALAEAWKNHTTVVETAGLSSRTSGRVLDWLNGVIDDQGNKIEKTGEITKTFWTEVSTIAADAAREISDSILGMFDLHAILIQKAEEYDDSYYENMIEAADVAYEAVRSLIEDQLDVLKEASSEELELIRKQYDEAMQACREYFEKAEEAARKYYDKEKERISKQYDALDAAQKKHFNAQELRIKRREEDEDIRYGRAYERQRKAIENSNMTEKEKQAALEKLEREYEDAKLARERAREDAKLKREEAHEKKLAAIRARERHEEEVAQIKLQHKLEVLAIKRENREKKFLRDKEAREQEAADRREAAEQAFLTQLLTLQQVHEDEKDALREAEDAARQAHADAEERRQNSLWTKLKGIAATSIKEIASTYLTKFLGKIIPGFGDIEKGAAKAGKALTDKLGGPMGNLGATAGKMASGFLTSLGSLGSIISGITGVIELLKGPQKQTDVTYWLKFIHENTKESRDWMFINHQEKLDFFALKLNDMGDWLLNLIDIQQDIAEWTVGIKDEKFNSQLDKMDWIGRNISAIKGYAETIAAKLSGIRSAASGYEGVVSPPTQLFLAHQGERVSIRPHSATAYSPAMAAGGSPADARVVRIEMPVYLDGRLIYTGVKEQLIDDSNRMGGLPLNTKGFVSA